MDALGTDFTIATPAFPDNGRTVFKGHLFVGDRLLSECGMKDHPLTPMTDSRPGSVLTPQTRHRWGSSTTPPSPRVMTRSGRGSTSCTQTASASPSWTRSPTTTCFGSVPAIADLRLVTAGSGVAIALPANWGFRPSPDAAAAAPLRRVHQAIVSGSVSVATNTQVAEFHRTGRPSFQVDALRIAGGEDVVTEALAFADSHLASGPVLVYSTQSPIGGTRRSGRLGAAEAG